jgi:uncharacterized protein (DUF697 family)
MLIKDGFQQGFDQEFQPELQEMELAKMTEKANSIVKGAVTAAAATGAIPIPFADAPLLIGEQVAMMTAISVVFKIKIGKDALKTLALAVLGTSGATIAGKTIVTNILKFIPIAGQIVGGVTSAATAGALTFALGKAFIRLCVSIKEGELSESDLTGKAGKAKFKQYFTEYKEKSK